MLDKYYFTLCRNITVDFIYYTVLFQNNKYAGETLGTPKYNSLELTLSLIQMPNTLCCKLN